MGRRLDDRATAEIFFPSPYRKVSDHSQFASHWAAVATKRLAVLCVGVHARFLSFLFRSAAFLVRALAAAFDAFVAISLRRSGDIRAFLILLPGILGMAIPRCSAFYALVCALTDSHFLCRDNLCILCPN